MLCKVTRSPPYWAAEPLNRILLKIIDRSNVIQLHGELWISEEVCNLGACRCCGWENAQQSWENNCIAPSSCMVTCNIYLQVKLILTLWFWWWAYIHGDEEKRCNLKRKKNRIFSPLPLQLRLANKTQNRECLSHLGLDSKETNVNLF